LNEEGAAPHQEQAELNARKPAPDLPMKQLSRIVRGVEQDRWRLMIGDGALPLPFSPEKRESITQMTNSFLSRRPFKLG